MTSTKIEKITHKGKDIFFVEFHGGIEEFRKTMQRQRELLAKVEGKQLFLNDATDLNVNKQIVREAINHSQQIKDKAKKGAIYGLKPMVKPMVNTLALVTDIDYKVFDTREEALEWLVS